LPLWEHVIGYEEGDERVVSQFQSGYPRFCCPPAITQLFAAAEQELGQRCIVFPRIEHAQRAAAFVLARQPQLVVKAAAWRCFGVLVLPEQAYKTGRLYWRYCGEIISTRQALHALGRANAEVEPSAGQAASASIRQRLATLSGASAEDIYLFPSGMAALFAVHRMLTTCLPGRKTVQLDFPYVDALKVQQEFGSGVHFLPVMDDAAYAQLEQLLATEPLAGAFTEVPSNPLLRCVDFPRLLEMKQRLQPELPLVLDDTVGTVVNVDALRVADVVTTSLTKSFSGGGNVLAGCVTLNRTSQHYLAFKDFMQAHAQNELWAADAVVLEQNSRDFSHRMRTISANGVALYQYLSQHPRVRRVWHSVNEGGPGYNYLQRENGGHGCLLSFVLQQPEKAPQVYDALRVCKGPSLGNNFTLVCPYTLLAHYTELDWAADCGVEAHLLRVSVGLEPQEDMIGRFSAALASF
jgi:cystathionine gamma-synthase